MNDCSFIFEFKNGVYLSNDIPEKKKNDGPKKEEPKPFKELAKGISPRFIERDSDEFATIDLSKLTNKLLDIEYDNKEYSHWSEIETPFLDMIFKHQKVPEKDMRWIYMQLGRLFYPLQLHEEWALVIFLHGVPRSGKSTIFNMICNIIGSQHINSKNGGPGVKLVALDTSVTHGLNIDELNKSIRSIVPSSSSMIIISSENPFDPDSHTAGHLFSIKFEYEYKGENINLEEKLKSEIGKIVRKTNEAYLESLIEYGEHGEDISVEYPEFFIQ